MEAAEARAPSDPELDPERDLAGALHEVSNALTVVLGCLETAQGRASVAGLREAIDIARAHARLGYCVARRAIGAPLVDQEAEATALRVARETVIGVTPHAQQKHVRVSLRHQSGDDAPLHSPVCAQQILLNLVLNAIAFSPENGAVTVDVETSGGQCLFRVTDQGPGIPVERADSILTAPESTRRGGAGIGLRYSAALARSVGGQLSLARTGPGACFELTWPLGEVRSGTRHPEVRPSGLQGACILVVEDDGAVFDLIALTLEARGATVVTASTLEQLRALGAEQQFDAALLDLSPIADDVGGALKLLRQSNPSMPVLLISGVASGIPVDSEHEFAQWVRKPFTMDELVSSLQTALGAG